MNDEDKSKVELIQELNEYRRRVAELQTAVSTSHTSPHATSQHLHSTTEHKKIASALQESEMRYKTIISTFRLMADNMPDLLWAKDMNRHFTFVNKAVCEKLLLAHDTDEPIGKDDMYFVNRARNAHPDNPEWHTFGELCIDSDKVVTESHQPEQFDEFGNVSGELLYLDVHKAPIWDADGNMVGTVGNGRIVTQEKALQKERQQTEAALQKTRSLFAAVTEQSQNGIGVANIEGNYTLVNAAFCTMTGYTTDELLSMNVQDLLPAKEEMDLFPRVVSKQSGTRITQLQRKDGSCFYAEISGSPIQSEGEQLVLGMVRDITERIQIEETLEMQASVLESMAEGVGVADENGRFVFTNSTFDTMFGYARGELLDKEIFILNADPPEEKVRLFNEIMSQLKKTNIWFGEFNNIKKNRELFTSSAKISSLNIAGKTFLILVQKDISKRKHVEAELKRLLAAERRQTSELKMLHEVSLKITASLKLEIILETIVDFTQEIMSAENTHIFLYDGHKVTFGAASWQNKRRKRPYSEVRPDGLTYQVARSGKQIVVPDVDTHPIYHDFKWHGAIIGLPLRIGDQVRGVMNVAYKSPRNFTEKELRSLGTFGDQAAIAIENATLFATERDTREQTEALINATTVLNHSLDQKQVLNLILEQLARVVAYDSASIMLMSKSGYEIVMHSGYSNNDKRQLPPTEFTALPHIQEVLQQQHPVIIPNTNKDPRWQPAPHAEHIYSWLGVPLIVQNQVIGILNLDKSEINYYTSSHAELALAFANQAAVAIENARLYQQAQQDAETKAMLLREVNHRVGNNLTAIAGMLSLERRHLQEVDKNAYQAIMADLTNRVMGLSTVHNMLSDSGWQPLQLEDIARQVIQTTLHSLLPDQHVSVEINAIPIQVTADLAHNFALLINELATNSVKYAILEQENAQITVNLLLDRGIVQFEFIDNGPGYPSDILNFERHNVGLDLIQRITRRMLQGEVSLHNNNGAVTIIRFKH